MADRDWMTKDMTDLDDAHKMRAWLHAERTHSNKHHNPNTTRIWHPRWSGTSVSVQNLMLALDWDEAHAENESRG